MIYSYYIFWMKFATYDNPKLSEEITIRLGACSNKSVHAVTAIRTEHDQNWYNVRLTMFVVERRVLKSVLRKWRVGDCPQWGGDISFFSALSLGNLLSFTASQMRSTTASYRFLLPKQLALLKIKMKYNQHFNQWQFCSNLQIYIYYIFTFLLTMPHFNITVGP